jgi:hypothetical protein
MRLIGITGRAWSGKDSVAAALQASRPGVGRAAFADALKAEAATAYGVDLRLFTDRDAKEQSTPSLAAARCSDPGFVRYLGSLAWFSELRPRVVMQQWGDWRRAADPDYWVKMLAITVDTAREIGFQAFVITDVRYPNELAWLREAGGVLWRVERPGLKPLSGHSSEWALHDAAADVTLVNDEDLDVLARRAVEAFDAVGAAA